MKRSLLYIMCSLALLSCSKSDDAVPNLLTEFCDVHINHDSIAVTATLDNGTALDIAPQGLKAAARDTTIRSVITYVTDGAMTLVYNNVPALCQKPTPAAELKSTPHDPVKLISIWRGGNYINMVLGEMTTAGGRHEYAFSIDSLRRRILYTSLIHKQPAEDLPSYTQKRYASMPLQVEGTEAYDSVSLSIVTYDGTKTFQTKHIVGLNL
ncbi:MAG: hypothetical protein IJV06_07370 [Bacteroidaceae bacterium]|nr:hypothetical protein [Bacteroidaceae bacterium]